jgi:hypothetical protein
MSVPFVPVTPPPTVPRLDNPPNDPDRIPREEPHPDPQPDQGAAPAGRISSSHCATWGLLCNGVRLQTEDRT